MRLGQQQHAPAALWAACKRLALPAWRLCLHVSDGCTLQGVPVGMEGTGGASSSCLLAHAPQQNFGAALRSAYFLGVDGVLTCHRNSAPLSAAVSKASAGAMELVPVHACK